MTSTTHHLPGYTGTAREAVVDGLRALADLLAADERLPLGEFVDHGFDIHVRASSAGQVILAAAAQDSRVDQYRTLGGAVHTTTTLRFGLVAVHVYHIAAAVTQAAAGAPPWLIPDVDPALQTGGRL